MGVRPKIFFFSKMVQDYGNRSADIRLVIQAVRHLNVNTTISIRVPNTGGGAVAARARLVLTKAALTYALE